MQKTTLIKNPQQEILLTTKRVIAVFIFMSIFIMLLIFRLTYLQVYKHNKYTTLSTQNRLDLIPLEPTRGLIYDRHGTLLAENIPVFSLDVIPAQTVHLSKSLFALKRIVWLTDDEINQFEKQRKQHRRFDEIPLKVRLTEQEVASFAENQYRFPGIHIKARLIRNYPFHETFSHVLGYVGRINAQELNTIDTTNYSASYYIGKSGIEKYYEEELHGQVGYEEVENDASGKPIRVLKEIKATPGKNLYLTLDAGLQVAVEKALQGHRGAVIAIDPATGQVLAMASEPGFDPNLFVSGISQKDYQTLQTSKDRPLYDRALQGTYPPGSTIKPFVALAGLNGGYISADQKIDDPGWFELSNHSHRFHDWKKYGHGRVDLNLAIASSCDTYFYKLADQTGIRPIVNVLSAFGFGNLTGIDLNHEQTGVNPSPEWKRKVKGDAWYDGDTIITSIGHGFMRATPLQLAEATSILANHGKHFLPYLLLGEKTADQIYSPQFPVLLDTVQLKNDQYWEVVIKAMQNVISAPQGTGYRYGRHLPYTIAGKTGTAAVLFKRIRADEEDNPLLLPERMRDHHLFIAFAPVNQPKIALAVVTENSDFAIETTRAIVDYYLQEKSHAAQYIQAKTSSH